MKKKKKWIVEIKTNRYGWYRVELLSINKGGTITVKLPSGEIVTKNTQHIHWGKTKRVVDTTRENGRKAFKYMKTKKKRRKANKPKKVRKLVDKWR